MQQRQSKKQREQGEQEKQGKKFTILIPYLIALFSGVLMGLTVAPYGAWLLAWIALAPLWVLVVSYSAQRKNPSPSALLPLSLAWGIGYHGVALSWITGIHPMTWMGVPWLASLAIALFCWVFISLWGAALVASWAIAIRVICRSIHNGFVRVLIGTALWCALEALWSAGPLYWSSVSYTQSPHNLAILHLGQLSGPSAVTAAIVAVNGLIAEAFINRPTPKAHVQTALDAKNAKISSEFSPPIRLFYFGSAVALFLILHLIGFGLYSRPLTQLPKAALKVGIVQGNVPNEIKLYPEGFRRAIEGYTNGYLTLANQGVDAVLTPEGALPFFQDEIMASSLVTAVREKGVVAWIGGFYKQGSSYTNSLFAIAGDGEIKSRYGKAKMVPIGEYIPFEPILGGIINRLSPLDEHQVPGSPNQVFDTPFGRAIVGICYESAFSGQFRRQAAAGGQFILSASNDAHYSAAMPAQHHAQDIMRAIETDRWAVRATNTGYSAFVNPHGRTVWISGHNTYEVHTETIYRRQTQTLYVRWGDWLTPSLLVAGTLAWCLMIRHVK
ncbi:apolipoprotein N-acyltransferase [Scytonema sp. HK-05]|uniref:apolipoprotein N-acyltransferase n=1 Tax=Scytonema sp. HK-05 TaxID=1137095 RepID=UPI000936B584|nr:apolipoprotein N-acyltransferase [Scytonema sp. HK-05]OKH59945.1 apolipoprotein N-acyltransferase [Scytonema sp. HK-05]BAY42612.1 apolipoprotein N-acyltransferase [Scytonema sp. HK-05]